MSDVENKSADVFGDRLIGNAARGAGFIHDDFGPKAGQKPLLSRRQMKPLAASGAI